MPDKAQHNHIPPEPFGLFGAWFALATETELNDPNAMALATVSAGGQPSQRVVLLKAWDARGFVFYTNLESHKSTEIKANPKVSLNFHWKSQRRQVRITGMVAHVSDAEADAYFATRARDSQIGAWASDQSRPLENRATFEVRLAAVAERFDGDAVPRPPHWSGFRVVPERMEFWQDRDYRLHERWLYVRDSEGWITGLLFP